VIGLVEAAFAPDELALIDGCSVGELPAHGRLGRCTGPRYLHENVPRGGIHVTGNNQVRLCVPDAGWRRTGGGHVPPHFDQTRILCRIRCLVCPLPLDRDQITWNGIDRRANGRGCGHGQRHGDGNVTRGARRARVAHIRDRIPDTQVGLVHHQVVTDLRDQQGGAVDDHDICALRSSAHDLRGRAEVDAIRQARIANRGTAGAGINRRHRADSGIRRGHGHRDLLIEMLLKQPGGRDCVTREHILAHDLRGHHGDQRHAQEQQTGDRERDQNFHQREAALTPRAAVEIRVEACHRTDRATIKLCVYGLPFTL